MGEGTPKYIIFKPLLFMYYTRANIQNAPKPVSILSEFMPQLNLTPSLCQKEYKIKVKDLQSPIPSLYSVLTNPIGPRRVNCRPASQPLAYIPQVSKCDMVSFFHIKLKLTHGLENYSSSLAYLMATSDYQSWLFMQVALDIVHHLCSPGKGLLFPLADTKKDALSLFANERKGLQV